MLDTKCLGNKTELANSIAYDDNHIAISTGAGYMFKVSDSNYYYATLRYDSKREVVKVLSTVGDKLIVTRGEDGTPKQSFPKGACVTVEWNPRQLCEFVAQCQQQELPGGVTGVKCIDCGSCLTIDNGRIVGITGEQVC